MKKSVCGILLLSLLTTNDVVAQRTDTLFLHVGSKEVDASLFKPHAARVRIYGPTGVITNEWDNELFLGDSAGRPVMRWSTIRRPVASNPGRPMSTLLQTYDAKTLAPYGYLSYNSEGAYLQLTINGKQVRGSRRANATGPLETIDFVVDTPGFVIGASDLVPVAAGMEVGRVMVAPLWGPNMRASEFRVFVVKGDTTVDIEGEMVRARKVEERRRSNGTLTANWYLLSDSPYMVYGEVPLPNGGIQRMTEVPIPPTRVKR